MKYHTQTSIFACNQPESDLRGTGALKYIRAMEHQVATVKKQSGQQKTISQVLSLQGGLNWYYPKAVPHPAHIWIRKAFDGTYAPFLFNNPEVVDQRCNFLVPRSRIAWEALAAVMTSSFFALSLEVSGSASLGAGALEMPTTKLSKVQVPDIRQFSTRELKDLVKYAKKVWQNDEPPNWKESNIQPSIHLKNLDEFLLTTIGSTQPIQNLYDGLVHTLSTRIEMSKEKTRILKKAARANVAAIAKSIIDTFQTQINAMRFPENTIGEGEKTDQIEVDPNSKVVLKITPFFSVAEIIITTGDDHIIMKNELPARVADVILKSLLLGRRKFSFPTDPEIAGRSVEEFWTWFSPLLKKIETECTSSSLGTRYEGDILSEVMKQLGWTDGIGMKNPEGSFILNPNNESAH